MLHKLHKIDNIQQIIDQVNSLEYDGKREYLNETSGNILSGKYTVKQEYINTPLGNLLEQLGDIGEARLLKLSTAESYTAHTDPDDRIHLAIKTTPHSYLIDLTEKQMYHLPVDGQLWMMNTGREHVASNFDSGERIHLNIRVRLPELTYPCYKIVVSGGSFDWKQRLYSEVMGYINRQIKEKHITGIEKINERELLLNCPDFVIQYLKDNVESKGFTIEVSSLTSC
jgi:hypothetical protein